MSSLLSVNVDHVLDNSHLAALEFQANFRWHVIAGLKSVEILRFCRPKMEFKSANADLWWVASWQNIFDYIVMKIIFYELIFLHYFYRCWVDFRLFILFTAQKNDVFHLLEKSLMENFIFCAVISSTLMFWMFNNFKCIFRANLFFLAPTPNPGQSITLARVGSHNKLPL